MLILPPGHAQELGLKRALAARERWLVGGVLGVVIALAVALVVALAIPGPRSSRGCIHLTVAGPTGGESFDQCGAAARALCSSATAPGAFPGAALIPECRKARLPTKR